LTFHRYTGAVPPFRAVPVNVTGIPSQTGFSEAVIDRLTGKSGLTIIAIVLDVAGFPVGQVALEVKIQETRSPSTGMYM
jgi:hypothetical protein